MDDPYLVIDYAYDYTLAEEQDILDLNDVMATSATNVTSDDVITLDVSRDVESETDIESFLDSDGWSITRLAIFGVAILLIVISNILLLVVIRRVRYLKTSSNRYVVSMAVADILMAVYVGLKITATVAPSLLDNVYLCLGIQLGWICLATVSQILVLFLAFDCYFSLWHPIRYNQVLTAWKANISILLAWLYSGAISVVPLMWIAYIEDDNCYVEDVVIYRYLVFLLIHFILCVIISIVVFIFVYYEIHTSKVVLKVYKKRRKQRQVYEERRKKDVQNAHCMTVIVGIYFIFWLPYYVILSITIFHERSDWSTLAETIAIILVIYHSSVNPMVYVCKLHTFQIACYKVLCCFFTNRFPSRPPSDNIQLRSLSFRNHVTGSMMSLHTTIGNDGKIVRVPHVLVTDYDNNYETRAAAAAAAYSHAPQTQHVRDGLDNSACTCQEHEDDGVDVWVTPRSPVIGVGIGSSTDPYGSDGSGRVREVYRKRSSSSSVKASPSDSTRANLGGAQWRQPSYQNRL